MKKNILFAGWLLATLLYFHASALAATAPVAKPAITTKLSLLPDDDKLAVNDTVKLRVVLKSQELANLASGKIVFDPAVFAVKKIDKSKSIASLWLFDPSIKKSSSSVSFGAAMIYPGFEGEGEVFNLDMKVIAKPATSTQVFLTDEEVFSADGSGDKPLLATTSFNPVFDAPTSSPKVGFAKFAIKSFTHDDEQWSNKSRASFYWPSGYTSSFSFNSLPNSDPGKGAKKQTNANFEVKKDGTYFFHLRVKDAAGASKLFHYKIRVDTKKPSDFIVASVVPKKAGDLLSVKLKAKDGLSGIAYYNIILDGKGKRVNSAAYSIAVKQSGAHRLAVRVFDKAGNYQETMKSFEIK